MPITSRAALPYNPSTMRSSKVITKTLGTRGSELARWQTNHVLMLLQQAWPDLQAQIQVITTQGDRVLDTPLPLMGGKGVFTAELESSLRSSQIDVAVHSLKDLPTDPPDGLTVGAIPARANPADVLISRGGYTLETLPRHATVGTCSTRRTAQLLHHRPDLRTLDIRGNIDSRIRKALDSEGVYDAIVLAYAGLERLNLLHMVTQVLSFDVMLPAPGQGALAAQCRDDAESVTLLAPINHLETAVAVTAERAFLAGLGGGCSVPVAALARREENGKMRLSGRVSSLDGATQIDVSATIEAATQGGATASGLALAREALEKGAASILEKSS